MSGSLTIRGARLVLPDRVVTGDLLVADGVIERIGPDVGQVVGEEIDAAGLTVLPGLVDTFSDVPLGDDGTALARVTGAAVAAGVTSMLLHDGREPAYDAMDLTARLDHAARHSRVNYGAYVSWLGGPEAARLDRSAGVRVHLGSPRRRDRVSDAMLDALFAEATRPLVVDGQDADDMAPREALYADAVDPAEHSRIYPPDLAATAAARVVSFAQRHGRPVHLGAITGPDEARLVATGPPGTTGFASVPHLFLRAETAYRRLGSQAVLDPPVRDGAVVDALWQALQGGMLGGVASVHTTMPLADKGTYPHTRPGLPTLMAMLPLLLDRAHAKEIALTRVAQWTSTAPAALFGLPRKGRLEVGFDGDLVLVDTQADVTVGPPFLDASGWSPFAAFTLRGRPVMTILRGRPVYRDGRLLDGVRGRELAYVRS